MLALQDDGGMWAWGFGEDGRLGLGTTKSHPKPVMLPPIVNLASKVVQIHCGGSHSIALTDAGQLYTWGRGKEGQLGLGDMKNRRRPTHVKYFEASGKPVVHVSGGNINSGALTNNGRIFTWGCTRHGERVTIPKISRGMMTAEGHAVYCGYHTVFMVTRSLAKIQSQLDHANQKELEAEMAIYKDQMAQAAEREQYALDSMIATKGGSVDARVASAARVCRNQASSAPVAARILSMAPSSVSQSRPGSTPRSARGSSARMSRGSAP